jgi:hypothetical protein
VGTRDCNENTQGGIMQYNKLTKKELEEYGRTLGIELDRRKNKNTIIAEIKKAEKKKTPAKKNKVTNKQPDAKQPKSIIGRIRELFGL